MNKHISLLLSLSFTGLFLIINSCKRHDPSQKQASRWTTKRYLGEAKDYLYFKPGTYWVYKNNITNEVDTVRILSVDTTEKNSSFAIDLTIYNYKYTHIQFVEYSSRIGREINNTMFIPSTTKYGCAINRDYTLNGTILSYGYFQYPFNLAVDTTKTNNSSPDFFGMKKNVVSGSYTFDSAAQIRVYQNTVLPASSILKKNICLSDHYFVKNVGLVKIQIRSYYPETEEIWELIDYKIKL